MHFNLGIVGVRPRKKVDCFRARDSEPAFYRQNPSYVVSHVELDYLQGSNVLFSCGKIALPDFIMSKWLAVVCILFFNTG